jgi:DNA-binding CsgD family transcriptional regulator
MHVDVVDPNEQRWSKATSGSSKLGGVPGLRFATVQKTLRLVGDVQDLGRDSLAWKKRAVAGLCDLVGAREGAVISFQGFRPGAKVGIDGLVHGGHVEERTLKFWAAWGRKGDFRKDPLVDMASAIARERVAHRRCDLVADTSWQSSGIYTEVADPCRIGDVIVGFFRHEDSSVVTGFALHREMGDRRFHGSDREIMALFVEEMHRLHTLGRLRMSPQDVPHLSPRQREVLDLLLNGKLVKEAAHELGLARSTALGYVKDLYRRLGVRSHAELLSKFMREGGL